MTQLLVQGSAILAQGPFIETDDAIAAVDVIFPKGVLGAWQIVDVDTPAEFIASEFDYTGTGLVKKAMPVGTPPVPASISPRQFRQSLTHCGFRTQVEAAIAVSTDQDLKDWYQFASDFQRNHPEVIGMAAALDFTDDQLDQVWIYGATL